MEATEQKTGFVKNAKGDGMFAEHSAELGRDQLLLAARPENDRASSEWLF